MTKLAILIRHAAPLVDPRVPSSKWPLGTEGRGGAESLAAELRRFAPASLASSLEPKAAETAAIIGARLGLGVCVRENLAEHRRLVGFLQAAEFHASIRALLENPSAVAFGDESADGGGGADGRGDAPRAVLRRRQRAAGYAWNRDCLLSAEALRC